MPKKIKIYDLEVDYDVDYRDIRYPRLEFRTGNLLLVLPDHYQDEKKVIEQHKNWIYTKHSEIIAALKESKKKKLVNRPDEEFKKLVSTIIYENINELKLSVNNFRFRIMKSKWASCSSRKNLMINTLLKYLPKQLIEYVVFHELVHLKERKHNENFWNIVSKKFPDHQKKEKNLFLYWFLIQRMLQGNNEIKR